MSSFGGAIAHCLRNLLRFRGRDTRSQFWFYILGLFIAQQIITALATILLMAVHFDSPASVAATPPENAAGFFASVHLFMLIALSSGVLAIMLLAAAVVRRLHDRGLSGAWGLLPVPFIVFSSVEMYRFFGSFGQPGMEPDHSLFMAIFISNALYLVALGALIVLLVRDSDPGVNRFGPPPLR